jgi:hypothetical protein
MHPFTLRDLQHMSVYLEIAFLKDAGKKSEAFLSIHIIPKVVSLQIEYSPVVYLQYCV